MNKIYFFFSLGFILTLRYADGKVISTVFSADEEEQEMAAMDRIVKLNTNQGLYKLFEGDVRLREEDLEQRENIEEKRNALRDRTKLWPTRIIPYEISPELDEHKPVILKAIEDFHNHSCLTFVPRSTETHWIKFYQETGCWSYVGRSYSSPGAQTVSLGSGCYNKGVIIHEILHALGFHHEQSRPDRDQYVEIFWENIMEEEMHNFRKYSHDYLDVLGVQYDLGSVMHYGKNAFTNNGNDTIKAISGATIGQRDGFSKTDIIKLNSLYNCHLTGVGWSDWSEFSPCTKNCIKKRQRYCFSNDYNNCPGASTYGVETQYSVCPNAECYAPRDGHWGKWSSWSACSKNCSMGTRSRKRTCTDPAPLYGGNKCPGFGEQFDDCFVKTSCNPDNCEFTSGANCHWTNNKILDYHWQTLKDETKTSETGPNGDHTNGLGYYIYAEASYPALPGDVALLTSKQFPPSQCRCITWYYSMFGKDIGQLAVYVKYTGGSRRNLWRKKGEQGDKWIYGDVTISNVTSQKYQVEFEAIRGSAFKGDIALDDIYFHEMPCGVKRLGCFNDRLNRLLPNMIASLRDRIDWSDIDKTIRECACIAHDQGYKYFAVQFYGECWASKDFVQYDKYGASDNCWFGVGEDYTNFVYTFAD